ETLVFKDSLKELETLSDFTPLKDVLVETDSLCETLVFKDSLKELETLSDFTALKDALAEAD
ncbi:hypothetical protein, partial [Streptococcus sp. CCH5-D3]|uniref:hypothetical protein n=1 Tax=Streptococcus sp. CCH5-D3 TaxID=1768764 RepID=UPI000B2040BA